MGSAHTYTIPGERDKRMPKGKDRVPHLAHSAAARQGEVRSCWDVALPVAHFVSQGVNVTIDASELAGLDDDMLRKKFEQAQVPILECSIVCCVTRRAQGSKKAFVAGHKEDVSDIMAEGTRRQALQRRKDEAKAKKMHDFKF